MGGLRQAMDLWWIRVLPDRRLRGSIEWGLDEAELTAFFPERAALAADRIRVLYRIHGQPNDSA